MTMMMTVKTMKMRLTLRTRMRNCRLSAMTMMMTVKTMKMRLTLRTRMKMKMTKMKMRKRRNKALKPAALHALPDINYRYRIREENRLPISYQGREQLKCALCHGNITILADDESFPEILEKVDEAKVMAVLLERINDLKEERNSLRQKLEEYENTDDTEDNSSPEEDDDDEDVEEFPMHEEDNEEMPSFGSDDEDDDEDDDDELPSFGDEDDEDDLPSFGEEDNDDEDDQK
jgi:hypothetical protein